ncbi:DUF2934 domain-containing protein [Mesorhizobium neociceri]|uniref:DUF2934 domain-containing protein n=1 Tax=Mesorhizobium neociceri TaxID=1307853 RepID=A0A838BA55_9HYPH|nr:DUF2934 domain-containing protein [Mesorhizobium neociceri]MBA1143072.1 DUF2934 domain-containing protein [Mesorhizobium neociceri]
MPSKEERIKQRAYEIWEREGHPAGRDQEHWDQAVQEIEAEGPEAKRTAVPPESGGGASKGSNG